MLKKIFSRTKKTEKLPPSIIGELPFKEIPRYPPFRDGLPSVSIKQILSTQEELIEKIRTVLGFTKVEYEKYLEPILINYVNFVHLLPASENHHHRGAGGLFRHGLEVGFYTAQFSEGEILANTGSFEHRIRAEPKWRLAAFICGIGHDLGKSCTDVRVTDESGEQVWVPLSQVMLYDWTQKNNIETYYLHWRNQRHKRHELFSSHIISRIVPDEIWEFLTEDGNDEISEEIHGALQSLNTTQPLARFMLKADQTSVAKDLKESRVSPEQFNYGVPVERYVLDVMKHLVDSGQWQVNQIDGAVWHTHEGTFIDWKNHIADVQREIAERRISGIPKDADVLAQILIERDYAIEKPIENSDVTYKYWDMDIYIDHQVNGLVINKVKKTLLKLASPNIIFSAQPPSICDAEPSKVKSRTKKNVVEQEVITTLGESVEESVKTLPQAVSSAPVSEKVEAMIGEPITKKISSSNALETPQMTGDFALHETIKKNKQSKKETELDLDELISAGMQTDRGAKQLEKETVEAAEAEAKEKPKHSNSTTKESAENSLVLQVVSQDELEPEKKTPTPEVKSDEDRTKAQKVGEQKKTGQNKTEKKTIQETPIKRKNSAQEVLTIVYPETMKHIERAIAWTLVNDSEKDLLMVDKNNVYIQHPKDTKRLADICGILPGALTNDFHRENAIIGGGVNSKFQTVGDGQLVIMLNARISNYIMEIVSKASKIDVTALKAFETNEEINVAQSFSELEMEVSAPVSRQEQFHIDNERKAFTKKITYEEVMEELFEQLKERAGRWVGNQVTESGSELVIPLTVLDLIVQTYPQLNKSELRRFLSQPRYKNQIKSGYIRVQKGAI